jgi:hypothetical protein
MTRDGVPMYIKGIAGGSDLPLAQQYGVNSTRTFSSDGASGILDDAKKNCMTVLLGISLSQTPGDYSNAQFTNGKRAEVSALLASIKNHPALLMWALGNEINLGADTQAAWSFVAELAQMIHQQDPNHPVISVLAGANVAAINHIVQWAPSLDAIGVNSYAAVTGVNAAVASSNFTGPAIVTEWGPTGHWECPNTSWARPIEETSGAKGRVYKTRYDTGKQATDNVSVNKGQSATGTSHGHRARRRPRVVCLGSVTRPGATRLERREVMILDIRGAERAVASDSDQAVAEAFATRLRAFLADPRALRFSFVPSWHWQVLLRALLYVAFGVCMFLRSSRPPKGRSMRARGC